MFAPGPLFERFFIFSGPRGFRQKKTSRFGLNEYSVQNEKLDCAYIHEIRINYRLQLIQVRWNPGQN